MPLRSPLFHSFASPDPATPQHIKAPPCFASATPFFSCHCSAFANAAHFSAIPLQTYAVYCYAFPLLSLSVLGYSFALQINASQSLAFPLLVISKPGFSLPCSAFAGRFTTTTITPKLRYRPNLLRFPTASCSLYKFPCNACLSGFLYQSHEG